MRRLPGPVGGLIAFLLVAALVFAGLGSVTYAALQVEQAQRQAAARAELANRLRDALWRLDGRMLLALGVEDNRPFYHYTPADPAAPYAPLLTASLPDWMHLHFQVEPAGWSSPQVLSPAVADALRHNWPELDLRNLNGRRQEFLDRDLKVWLPAPVACDLFAARDSATPGNELPFAALLLTAGSRPALGPDSVPGPGSGHGSGSVLGTGSTAPAASPAKPPPPTEPPSAGPKNPPDSLAVSPAASSRVLGIELQSGGERPVTNRPAAEPVPDGDLKQADAPPSPSPRPPVANVATAANHPLPGRVGLRSTANDREVDKAWNDFLNRAEAFGKGLQEARQASGDQNYLVPYSPGLRNPILQAQGSGDGKAPTGRANPAEPPPPPPDLDAAPSSAPGAAPSPLRGTASVEKQRRHSGDPAATAPGAAPSSGSGAAPAVPPGNSERSERSVEQARLPRGRNDNFNFPASGDDRTTVRPAIPPAIPPGTIPPGEDRPWPDTPTSSPTAIHLSAMRPLWVTAPNGVDWLVLVRSARLEFRHSGENKTIYQGVVLDWSKLEAELRDQVRDEFPEARLVPIKNPDGVSPERAMTALPVQLDPGAEPTLPPAGWTPLRLGLVSAWLAAVIAFAAVGLSGWSLFDLAERRIRFVSAVTHELRTPLTSLRLYTDLLVSGLIQDEAKRREYLTTLAGESDRLHRLIDNVLDYARLEKKRKSGDIRPVPVSVLVEQLRATWADRLAQDGKELVVVVGVPADREVATDAALVQQIVGNLIDNARKYSRDAADPRVWLSVVPGPGRRVRLEVEDRGPGIPPAERRCIFKPFRRGQRAEGLAGGVGLGLALARSWAEVLGARLTYHPAAGGTGACFRLELPG